MMMNRMFQQSLFAAGMAFLLAGCGAVESGPEEQEQVEAAELGTQQQSLTACGSEEAAELEEVAEHACTHATYGPFESVTAAALGAPVLVDVSTHHTAYNITLPSIGYWGWAGRVAFIPDETTEFAFLLSRHRGLRIFKAATNTEVGLECRYAVPSAVCSNLKAAYVAELEGETEYYLEFRSLLPQNASFQLVIEETAHDHEE